MLIAATGYGQPKEKPRTVEASFDCRLMKPVHVPDLVTMLDQQVVNATSGSQTSP